MVFGSDDFEDFFTKDRKVLTVTQLNTQIKGVLDSNFSEIWLEGEISNFKHHSSGHMYLTLKDENSQISAVMFRGNNIRLRFRPEDGMKVLVLGRVSIYEPRGSYQFYINEMEPKGIGDLQLAFEQLKEKLAKEGLFDDGHKRAIPEFPEVIGIVTSPTGAAIRDIQNVLSRRFSLSRVILIPVRVQGKLAAQEITDAIDLFNEYGEVDVLIVGRGGGSIEDLWPFNEEIVARAIYRSDIPVISAVGHEVDFTISDFTADLRAPTPSAAAELVVKDKQELVTSIRNLKHQMANALEHKLEVYRNQLSHLMTRSVFTRAQAPIEEKLYRLDDITQRLFRETKHNLRINRERVSQFKRIILSNNPVRRLGQLEEKLQKTGPKALFKVIANIISKNRLELGRITGTLNALSPLSVLNRGYSIAFTVPDSKILKSISQAKVDSELKLRVSDGLINCKIKNISEVDK